MSATETSYVEVSDATFEQDVVARSSEVVVVVDLWAPWCGPCRQLGPILEDVIAGTDGKVVLAKVNVDENPSVSQAFSVQSIPAVYALKDRKVVDGFVGAKSRGDVLAFVEKLLPSSEDDELNSLIEAGDEESLRKALELDPPNQRAIISLAELLVSDGRGTEALDLLNRIAPNADTRRVAALARTGTDLSDDQICSELRSLLDVVSSEDEARLRYLDLLELLGVDDPRTASFRKQLTARLF